MQAVGSSQGCCTVRVPKTSSRRLCQPRWYNESGLHEPRSVTLMPRDLILGTAGHIDHGKTSLVKALTGIDCDRLPEEKRRGITIDIGFATLDLGEYRLGIVDVP